LEKAKDWNTDYLTLKPVGLVDGGGEKGLVAKRTKLQNTLPKRQTQKMVGET